MAKNYKSTTTNFFKSLNKWDSLVAPNNLKSKLSYLYYF